MWLTPNLTSHLRRPTLLPGWRQLKPRLRTAAVIVFAIAGVSCTSPQQQSTTKLEATTAGPLGKTIVVTIDRRAYIRQVVEGEFVRWLRRRGIQAQTSHRWLSIPDVQGDREQLNALLAERDVDTVLVTGVTGRADVTANEGFKDPHADWHGVWNDYATSRYYQSRTTATGRVVIRLETKLYRVSDEALLWSAETDTELKESADWVKRVKGVAKGVVALMAKDGLLD